MCSRHSPLCWIYSSFVPKLPPSFKVGRAWKWGWIKPPSHHPVLNKSSLQLSVKKCPPINTWSRIWGLVGKAVTILMLLLGMKHYHTFAWTILCMYGCHVLHVHWICTFNKGGVLLCDVVMWLLCDAVMWLLCDAVMWLLCDAVMWLLWAVTRCCSPIMWPKGVVLSHPHTFHCYPSAELDKRVHKAHPRLLWWLESSVLYWLAIKAWY